MKTKELIAHLEETDYNFARQGYVEWGTRRKALDEIIQKLREFDELKRVIHDTVDTAIELYSLLFALTGEDDSEGSFGSMEE